MCEYEADRTAARLTSPQHLAGGLRRIKMINDLMQGPIALQLLQKAAADPTPLAGFSHYLQLQRRDPIHESTLQQSCQEAFLIPTGNSDTHPALTDRLRSVGADPAGWPAVPLPATPSAATVFLDASLEELRQAVDLSWQKAHATFWQARHTAAVELSQRAALVTSPAMAGRTAEHLWEEATTLQALHGTAAAAPVLERLIAAYPTHAAAQLALGEYLMEKGPVERGEACLEEASRLDPDLLEKVSAVLGVHYRRTGQAGRLKALASRLDQHEIDRENENKERSNITVFDTFIPHGLTPPELAALTNLLAGVPMLAGAHLVRKQLRHRPSKKLFILALQGQGGFLKTGALAHADSAVRLLTPKTRLPGRVLIIAAGGTFSAIARKAARSPLSQIWPPPLNPLPQE